MSLNRVMAIGRLTADPELRHTPSGASVTNFTLAVNERWTDKNGDKQERCEFMKIVAWGKLADLCGQFLAKGRQVYLEGKLQTRQWDDKDGHKKYTTEILASTIQFLGAKETNEPGADIEPDDLPF